MDFQQTVNAPGFSLCTQRLCLVPLEETYFADYARGMDAEVTRYQYPDPFPSLEAAERTLSQFCLQNREGKGLFLAVLEAASGTFLGAVEVSELDTKTPEIGLWLCVEAQGNGFGHEALAAVLHFCRAQLAPDYFLYEVDGRNAASIRLAQKFGAQACGCEQVLTPSGKNLALEQYHIVENT